MTKFLYTLLAVTLLTTSAIACDCAQKAKKCGCEQGKECVCP